VLYLGIGLTVALIAAVFVMVWFKRMEQKFMAGVLVASAVVGFIVANVNAITKVRFGQFELVKQELAVLKEQQQRQDSTLKVTAENQYLLTQSPAESQTNSVAKKLLKAGSEQLMKLAFPDSAARTAKVQELDNRLKTGPQRAVTPATPSKPAAIGAGD
jgi:general stress protein CsbA